MFPQNAVGMFQSSDVELLVVCPRNETKPPKITMLERAPPRSETKVCALRIGVLASPLTQNVGALTED